jgi:hypothetical protein
MTVKFLNISINKNGTTTTSFEYDNDHMVTINTRNISCVVSLYKKIEEGGFGDLVYSVVYDYVPSISDIVKTFDKHAKVPKDVEHYVHTADEMLNRLKRLLDERLKQIQAQRHDTLTIGIELELLRTLDLLSNLKEEMI